MNRRVVITGLGVVSSIGIGKDEFWKNLISGKSGISKITSFDTSKYDRHYGGEVKDFKPEEFIHKNRLKKIGRASQFAIAAAKMALKDAGIKLNDIRLSKAGVIIGTTMAEAQAIEEMNKIWVEYGHSSVGIKLVPQYPGNVLANNVALELHLKGPNYTLPTACAAGNYSLGYGYDLIKLGKAETILAGGTDSFSRIAFTGFNRLYAVAPELCQPFDKNRKGMLVGEGSGILVLETLDNAIKRNASIYAEILGYGLSCDAQHMTSPSEEGITKVMHRAMAAASIKPEEVDYISPHGTGTPANDKAECAAIKKIFNGYSKKIPISSIKSMLGHTMGAASAIEAITCCLAIRNSIIPPTINYKTPDPDCDIDCVPNTARGHDVNIALNNSYAFGGNNACLVLSKFKD